MHGILNRENLIPTKEQILNAEKKKYLEKWYKMKLYLSYQITMRLDQSVYEWLGNNFSKYLAMVWLYHGEARMHQTLSCQC